MAVRARDPRQFVKWFVSAETFAEFHGLVQQIGETEEGSDEFEALKDAIQSLPGYPQGINPELAHIYPILTTYTVH